MSIYFRTLKYKSTIDCWFQLRDGPNYDDVERCLVGDTVSIIFDVTPIMAREINNLGPSADVSACSTLGKDWSVAILFTVTERRHGFGVRKDKISLQKLGVDIFVEAQNGYWEDVFLWVVRGVVPSWADLEEEEHGR